MSTINDATRQQAQDWSRQLGTVAAELRPGTPPTDLAQVGKQPAPDLRQSSLLARYLHRNSAQQQAAHKLKANEFMSGG